MAETFTEYCWRRMGTHNPDILSIISEAKQAGIELRSDEVRAFVKRLSSRREGCELFAFPEVAEDFIRAFVADRPPRRIMDVWAGAGLCIADLARATHAELAIGINKVNFSNSLAESLHADAGVTWVLADPLLAIDKAGDAFDLVIGCPPFNMQPQDLSVESPTGIVNIRDAYGNLVLLKGANKLSQDGVGFFIVPPVFMFGQKSVRLRMADFGLCLNAVLSLPAGTFSPCTNIPTLLLVVTRKKTEQVFLGEVVSDAASRKTLIQNLKDGKEGKTPQLGILVAEKDYNPLASIIAGRERQSLVAAMGVLPHELMGLCKEVNLPKKSDSGNEFDELPNAIYLPIFASSAATTILGDLQVKPQNCVQLVLKDDVAGAIADPEYIADFLNSPFGRRCRDGWTSGTTIPKISKRSLENAVIYLPTLEVQTQVLQCDSTMRALSSQIANLRNDLWRFPRKAKEIAKVVSALNQKKALEAWLDKLPAPLGLILWAYEAGTDHRRKEEHLLLFFEAYCEFTATIMLSAYASNTEWWAKYCVEWIETDPKFRDWIKHANFGGWLKLCERLAKLTRKLLSDGDTKDICTELFGSPEKGFLEMLTNKKQFAILTEVNKCRNEWKGHSPVVNDEEHGKRLAILEKHLDDIRQVITDAWDCSVILQPCQSEYADGVYDYEVNALVGTRTPFKRQKVQTIVPMDKKRLYLLHLGQKKPLQLLPLFQMRASPRTEHNACYFYSRVMEKGKICLQSYHYEDEASIEIEDKELLSTLNLLLSKNGGDA